MIGEDVPQDYISKQDAIYFARCNIITLYKQFLILIEDLKKDQEINFDKLKAIFPNDTEVINLANFFGEQQFQHYRKRSLDYGNSAIRNFEQDIKNIV